MSSAIRRRIVVLSPLLFLGCAPVLEQTVDRLHEDRPIPVEDLTVAPGFDKRAPRVVAVLPLENETPDAEGPEIVRRLFYGNFSALPFRDVELSKVDAVLEGASTEDVAELGKKLSADGLVRGKVIRFERNYYGIYADLQAEVEFELVAAATGEVLWKARAEEAKRNVSLSLSPVSLAVGMVGNVLEISRMALIRTTNDACRRAVRSIPVPGRLEGRPEVFEFTHNGLGRVLKKGDRLEVALEGSPGLVATFGVPGVRADIPLREGGEKKGLYTGVLALPEGIEASGVVLEAALSNDRGEVARWVDASGSLRIDTKPPAAVGGLRAEAKDAAVELAWVEGQDRDLSLFRVLRSDSPLQGYVPAGDTQSARYTDTKLTNDRDYFYKVVAVDAAGNESEPSGRVRIMPVAPGPRPIRGTLRGQVFWPRAGGPYVLDGDVEVARGSSLTLEAGTVVQGRRGSGLRILGTLSAEGSDTQRIALVRAEKSEPWAGVTIQGPGGAPSSLSYVRIDGASTGLTVADASPKVDRLRVSGCEFGIVVEGAEAVPKITVALVHENGAAGIAVRGLAAPVVSQCRIFQNGGPGVTFEDAGGLFFQNEVAENRGGGLRATGGTLKAGFNRIEGNSGFELSLLGLEKGFPTIDLNYWGEPESLEAAASVALPRRSIMVLSRPEPKAPTAELPILDAPPPEGLPSGLWIRRKPYLTQVVARPRAERSPFVVGVDALEAGDYPAAAAALARAAEQNPGDPEAYFWLGAARMGMGKPEEAAEAFQKACLLDVKSVEYRAQLAEAYLAAGKKTEAELTFREVLRLDPGNERAKALVGSPR